MAIFERWFRSRFVREGDFYLYYVREGAVRFEPEEVEVLVADWRETVTSPLIWGAWVLLGVALPLWMMLQRSEVQLFGIAIAVVAASAFVVTLVYADGGAERTAQTRMLERLEGVQRPSLLGHLLWVACLGCYAWRSVSEFRKDPGFDMFDLGLALLLVVTLLFHSYRFLRDRRRWQDQVSGR